MSSQEIPEPIYKDYSSGYHLAGIIPIIHDPFDFNMMWEDCLMPIEADYTLFDHAIMTAAWAGCHTIWVVASKKTQAMVRKRIGDYVIDPYYFEHDFQAKPYNRRTKTVPVFYVTCNPVDIKRRDSTGYAALHGARVASKTSRSMSRWLIPDKYFICYPFGVVDFDSIKKYRQILKSKEDILFTFKGETCKDNLYIPTALSGKKLNKCREDVFKKSTTQWEYPEDFEFTPDFKGEKERERLPASEMYSARFFDLGDVFEKVDEKEVKLFDLDNYWNVNSWESYREFLVAENNIKRPYGKLFNYREFNRMSFDKIEEQEIDNE